MSGFISDRLLDQRTARKMSHRIERLALNDVERAAREYAEFTHGNIRGPKYRAREEARERLRDALASLDAARGVA